MAGTGDAVEDHRHRGGFGHQLFKAQDQRRRALGHGADIEHENGWQLERHGEMGGGGDATVKHPHDPFDDADIGAGAVAGQGLATELLAAHPQVEVTGSAAGDQQMQPGVDEIGPAFKGLND